MFSDIHAFLFFPFENREHSATGTPFRSLRWTVHGIGLTICTEPQPIGLLEPGSQAFLANRIIMVDCNPEMFNTSLTI